MNRTRLPERNLDVMRAIAVTCVVVDHVLWARNRSLPFITDWQLGRAGVLLFFVHTSLVLMSSLERGGSSAHWVRKFYTRRAFRIYPLAIVAVLATVVFRIPSNVPDIFTQPASRTIAANLLLVQNISNDRSIMGMLWTLPIEVQMYVMLPLLFLAARKSVYHVLVVLTAGVMFALAVQYAPVPGLWRLGVGIFVPCFIGGVLAFAILRLKTQFKLPAWTWIPFLAVVIASFVLLGPTATRPEPGWLFCIAVGCAIPFVTELSDSKITRVAKTMCTYSYGTYLLLVPALWIGFVELRTQAIPLQWLAFGAALFALPWTAYTFIERPGIETGRRLTGGHKVALASTIPVP